MRLPPGFCIRTIASGLLRPRQLALGPAGEILVAESSPDWRPNRGRVSVLRPQSDGSFAHTVLLEHLDRPHGIAFRDGAIYVAESGRIIGAPYDGTDAPLHAATVVGGLPATGLHVHRTLGIGPDGPLYYSVGAASNNCGAHDTTGVGEEPCAEAEGVARPAQADAGAPTVAGPVFQRGALYRVDLARRRPWIFARGLRNNLGFAWHPATGRMWGVDNGRDYIQRIDARLLDAQLPHDELNELLGERDYGWPYCYDDARASPEYPARDAYCRRATRRPVLLPAHAAPISILFYEGTLFPARYRGRAVVTYHGYRANGHRVVTIPFGADGAPSGEPEDLISGWEERPGRPHGHALGLAVGLDGALFVTDDIAGAVYALAYGSSAAAPLAPATPPLDLEASAVVEARCGQLSARGGRFAEMERGVVDARCVLCHASAAGGLLLRRCDLEGNFARLRQGTSPTYGPYVVPGHVDRGYLLARVRGDAMGPRMPPPGSNLDPGELEAIEAWVREGAVGP